MLILGFESSAKAASVAVTRDGGLLAQYFQNSGLTHSRTLLPMAEDMLKNLDLKLAEIDLIAVARGPGSFTGVRIGVSVAKGLAWAAEKKTCGVSTLEAMAYNGVYAPQGAVICCAMDARRSQVYNALFEMKRGEPIRLCPDRAISLDELCEDLKQYKREIYLIGDGASLCEEALKNTEMQATPAPEPQRNQSAWGVCQAAQKAPQVTANELLPVYLRISQAEQRAMNNE